VPLLTRGIGVQHVRLYEHFDTSALNNSHQHGELVWKSNIWVYWKSGRTCGLITDQFTVFHLADCGEERIDVILGHRLRQVVDDDVGFVDIVAGSGVE